MRRLRWLSGGETALAFSALLLGCALALGAELWWHSHQPNLVQVHSVKVSKLPYDGHVLLVASSGPPAKDCLRLTEHIMLRDQTGFSADVLHLAPWLQRDYVPLGMGLNGVGFNSVADFTVTLYIPPDVPLGRWQYVNRSVYICTVFPGFVRFTESRTAPVWIDLD